MSKTNKMTLYDGTATRIENLIITIDIDSEQFDRVRELVKIILGHNPPKPVGIETLKVTYTFIAEYFGTVEQRLGAVLKLLNTAGVIVHVDSNLIGETTCLLARVIEKLRQVQNMTAQKETQKET